MTNRTRLVLLGSIACLVLFAGAVQMASASHEYQAPSPAPAASADQQATEKAAAEKKAREKPYEEATYRTFPVVGSRVAIWMVAQLHLLFAAFVLAVPIFALIVEAIGYKTGDRRYDRLAHEFTKLLSVSFSLTATFGAALTFMLIVLYPKFTNYLMSVFSPTFLPYVVLFFFEAFFLYTYYYGWGKFHPLVHLGLGLGLNVVGTGIMLIANSWLTFMMSPNGVSSSGALLSLTDAIYNYTWMPINVHRVIANVAFGGSVAAAYAAFKFLHATTDEERAHYDWMGYIGNMVAISAFLPLPFAGYWLAKEIYAYSQTLGLTMMGGAFSWLFIIQAVLIGNLFLGANYYLWLGMGRVEGAQPFQRFVKYLLAAIVLCFMVWATPRSIIATVSEIRAMGGSAHPVLGFLGVMSAKNTAVNILILTTFMSFLLYRRTGKIATVSWAKTGHAAQLTIFGVVAVFVIFLGVYGYFVEATVRIRLSVPQVLSVLFAMVAITAIDVFLYRAPKKTGEVRWGRIPAISQVRADLHRGHLHLAHGAHGLRSLRAPPALACLRHHSGQFGRRVHAHARLRDESRLGDRAPVLPPDWPRVLDCEPARPARFRGADQSPHRRPPPGRTARVLHAVGIPLGVSRPVSDPDRAELQLPGDGHRVHAGDAPDSAGRPSACEGYRTDVLRRADRTLGRRHAGDRRDELQALVAG